MTKVLICEKTGSFPKRVFLCTNARNARVILKERRVDVVDEYRAFQLLRRVGLSRHVARVFPPTIENGVCRTAVEYVPGDLDDVVRAIPPDARGDFWLLILTQLAFVVATMESHGIQHNDFTPSNLRIRRAKTPTVKIIDLETLVDYRDRVVYPSQVVDADDAEQERMGWSTTFHPGADLNQMLGELLERYEHSIPAAIRLRLESRIVSKAKEFPYAIAASNRFTTGAAILEVLTAWEAAGASTD